jgi:hypothetical protein
MAATDFGETWTYESIIGALPGIDVSNRLALAIQVCVFEIGVLVLAWYYDLWDVAVAGTAVVAVAAIGSAEMLRVAGRIRTARIPRAYRRLLFGSDIEVVLGVLAFVALLTYLFVPGSWGQTPPIETLFGERPPVLVVYLVLLILWDVCYRIGTGWWAAITALWRSYRYAFDPETARTFRLADAENLLFGLVQLLLVPFVLDFPVLVAVLLAHVGAIVVVSALSIWLLSARETDRAIAAT